MSSTVTRRDAITGTAAAALTAGASLPAFAADHPDAQLLDLWRQRQALASQYGGLDDDAAEALHDELFAVDQAIAAAPAHTVEGVMVKIRVMGSWQSGFAENVMAWPLYSGLVKDAERLGLVASEPIANRDDEVGFEIFIGGDDYEWKSTGGHDHG